MIAKYQAGRAHPFLDIKLVSSSYFQQLCPVFTINDGRTLKFKAVFIKALYPHMFGVADDSNKQVFMCGLGTLSQSVFPEGSSRDTFRRV